MGLKAAFLKGNLNVQIPCYWCNNAHRHRNDSIIWPDLVMDLGWPGSCLVLLRWLRCQPLTRPQQNSPLETAVDNKLKQKHARNRNCIESTSNLQHSDKAGAAVSGGVALHLVVTQRLDLHDRQGPVLLADELGDPVPHFHPEWCVGVVEQNNGGRATVVVQNGGGHIQLAVVGQAAPPSYPAIESGREGKLKIEVNLGTGPGRHQAGAAGVQIQSGSKTCGTERHP